LAGIILILQRTKLLENLAQHCDIVTWDDVIIKNAVYRQWRTFNRSFSKEKNM